MPTATPKSKTTETRSVAARWGKTNYEAGWTAVPTVLFQRQKALGLDATDINIILHLVGPWWDAERFPFIGVDRIAAAMDITKRTVQRRITQMEKAGFVKRVPQFRGGRQLTNVYDLRGLVRACKPFSQEVLEDREQRRTEAAARSTRKGPRKLTLVGGKDK